MNRLFRPSRGAIDHSVDADQGCRYGLRFAQICLHKQTNRHMIFSLEVEEEKGGIGRGEVSCYINDSSAPVTEEIGGKRARSDEATNVVTFIQSSSDNLTS